MIMKIIFSRLNGILMLAKKESTLIPILTGRHVQGRRDGFHVSVKLELLKPT